MYDSSDVFINWPLDMIKLKYHNTYESVKLMRDICLKEQDNLDEAYAFQEVLNTIWEMSERDD